MDHGGRLRAISNLLWSVQDAKGGAAFNDRWRRVRGGGDLRRRVRDLISVSVLTGSALPDVEGVDFGARILICPYIPSVNSLRPRLMKSFTPLSSASTVSSSSPVKPVHNLSTYRHAVAAPTLTCGRFDEGLRFAGISDRIFTCRENGKSGCCLCGRAIW